MRALLVFAFLTLQGCGLQSEDALRKNFADHRKELKEITEMARKDSRVIRITPEFTRLEDNWAWPRDDIGITEQRWNRYRALFKNAGITDGIDTDKGNVLFYVSSAGLSVSGATRGYAYVDPKPELLVSNLGRCPNSEEVCYVPLEGNWYLFQWITY